MAQEFVLGMDAARKQKGIKTTGFPISDKALYDLLITTIVAIVVGMLYSLLLAVACVTLKADQTLVGTAMNLLATALAIIVSKRMSDRGASTSIQYNKDAFIFKLFGVEMNVFLIVGIIALVAAIIVLYKLRFGLRLKACGENPSAADSVGINVTKYRYAGVLISGALAGIGALAYILPTQSSTASTALIAASYTVV